LKKVNWRSVNRRLADRYGGWDAYFAAIEKRIERFRQVWEQDIEQIGRILRAHLAVEHFLTEHLIQKNRTLGDLRAARLTYDQKLTLLSPKDPLGDMLLPGLRLLGTIRNRVSHRLHVELSKADEDAFFAVEAYRYFRLESDKRFPPEPMESERERALYTLEDFAEYAAGMFHQFAEPEPVDFLDVMTPEELAAMEQQYELADKPPDS
jgi:hypothetical protein